MSNAKNVVKINQMNELFQELLENFWSGDFSADEIPPVMLWGAPGIGKSTIVRNLAKKYGVGFIDVRLAQREPVDIRGLPVPTESGVEWRVSSEWPRDPNSKGIIIFDELTAADRSLQVAAYEFILDRRLGDLYKVPDGWYICAAGNRITDRAVANTMSSALANRFLHVELENDAEDWINWAGKNKIHPSVINFIKYRPQLLFSQDGEDLERGWPSPRSWARVSTVVKMITNHKLLRNAVFGLVGPGAGTEFLAFHKVFNKGEDIREMMLNPKKAVRIPEKSDQRYAMCAAISYYLLNGKDETESAALMDGFFRISMKMSSDFAAMLMTEVISSGGTEIAEKLYNHPMYEKWNELHGVMFAGE